MAEIQFVKVTKAFGSNKVIEDLDLTIQDGKFTVLVGASGCGKTTLLRMIAGIGPATSGHVLMDGKDITEEISVPQATTGENNYDEYNTVEAKVNLTEGEHILRFTVTGDWMDIDWIEFCAGESCEDTQGIRTALSAAMNRDLAPRLLKKGNKLFIEKNGRRFDLTGHRIK